MSPAVRLLPSAITLTSLLSASTALVLLVLAPTSAARDALVAACIAWSMVADGLDGPLARKLNAQTSFGAHIDSLCDLAAFGIVPPLWLMARLGLSWGAVVVVPGVLWVVAAAVRLARFNDDGVVPGRFGPMFKGVPTPVAAATIVVAVAVSALTATPAIEVAVLCAGVVLMPSTVPYPKAGIGRWPWVVAVPIAVVVLGHHAALF